CALRPLHRALPALPTRPSSDLEVPPLTVQFAATPLSTTVWLPGASPLKVVVALSPIARLVVPSRRTEERRGGTCRLAPPVAVVTLTILVVEAVGLWPAREAPAVG